jgi:peptide subunit release factor 1 (eRF1)
MREVLRRLAELEPSGVPVLSVYLDLRPEATGEAPGRRSGLVVLKDRLREVLKTLGPRGEDRDSVEEDSRLIELYLEEEASRAAQGVAIFACSARGLFEAVESGVPFENQVSAGDVPDLFQLARLLDEQETAVVALVDSNTARLFVTRVGALEERGGPDDDSVHFQKRSMGGWSQARYQRHIDKHRSDFAREVAAVIERLIDDDDAVRLVLAGDEVALTPLQAALSQRARAIADEPIRLDIRAQQDEIHREIAPILARLEADDARAAADRLIDAVRADGLGVAGQEHTLLALEQGQVDELLLAPNGDVDESARNELIRLAALTGASVEIVADHPDFEALGGVGAFLRYRLSAREPVFSE